MTAISIWEPWATAMLLGLKRIETRSWPTSHKGDLLICASKRPLDATAREVLLNIHLHSGFDIQPNPGMALCVVRLIRCDRITEERRGFKALDGREPALLEEQLGDYTPGRFAWATNAAYLRPLARPFPVRGQQGLFDVPDGLIKAAGVAE